MGAAAKLAGLSLIQQYLKAEHGSADILDARSGDLVEAMPFLLQLISRQTEALSSAVQALNLAEDVIWDVAVRLLKNIYFAYPDDEYRVLGLNPWCGIAEARDRHRHLIRLFHPDRGMLSSADGEPDFAAVINRAYTNISHSNAVPVASQYAAGTSQKNYASKYKLGRQFKLKIKTSGQIHMVAVAAALGIYKLTPRSVWLVLIIISMAFIAQKYWTNQHQTGLVGPKAYEAQVQPDLVAENNAPKVGLAAEKPAPILIETDKPVMVSEVASTAVNQPAITVAANSVAASAKEQDVTKKIPVVAQAASVAAPGLNTQTTAVKTLPKAYDLEVKSSLPSKNSLEEKREVAKPIASVEPEKSLQKPVLAVKENATLTKKPAAGGSQPVQAPTPPMATAKVAIPQIELARAVQPVSDNHKPAVNAVVNKEQATISGSPSTTADAEGKTAANIVQTSNPAVRPAELSNEELDRVIKSLVASYNKGDLESFMQLLEDEVKTDEPGGKSGLRQAYAKLFSKTTQREMQLRDLNWQRNGEVATTSPKYMVSVTQAATSEPKVYRGVLQFEVVRREGRPIIHAFYHLPEGSNR